MVNRRSLIKPYLGLRLGENTPRQQNAVSNSLLMGGFWRSFYMADWPPVRGHEDDLIFSWRMSGNCSRNFHSCVGVFSHNRCCTGISSWRISFLCEDPWSLETEECHINLMWTNTQILYTSNDTWCCEDQNHFFCAISLWDLCLS